MVVIVGIDLAGSEKRNSGFCVISGTKSTYGILRSDKEIISLCRNATYVGIDAPLSLPKGRRCIEEKGPQFRQCDLELRKLGIRFFPIFLGPMRRLTERGIKLSKELAKGGAKVYEVYPGATYDLVGLKRKDKKAIARWCGAELENRVSFKETQDVLDGICCAITIKLFLEGKGHQIGDKKEGVILVPKAGQSIFKKTAKLPYARN